MGIVWTRSSRFSALMNGVFVGVGIIFLIWGITDIAFPIAERMNVAVFGLMRILLGIVSLSVGIGVEAVQWAKIEKEIQEPSPEEPTNPQGSETTQPHQTTQTQAQQ